MPISPSKNVDVCGSLAPPFISQSLTDYVTATKGAGKGSRKRVENALSCYHRGARSDRPATKDKKKGKKGEGEETEKTAGKEEGICEGGAAFHRAALARPRKLFAFALFLLSRDSPRKARREKEWTNERTTERTSRQFKTRRFRVVPQAGARAGTASRRLLPAR